MDPSKHVKLISIHAKDIVKRAKDYLMILHLKSLQAHDIKDPSKIMKLMEHHKPIKCPLKKKYVINL